MIIEFSKNTELSDWIFQNEAWCVRRDAYHNVVVSVGKYLYQSGCFAIFFLQLDFLHNYFPKFIDGDLEFSKDYVDQFLIKMSKLTAFL